MYFFIGNCVTEWHIFPLWNLSYCHKKSRRKGKRGTRWPEEEALAMYLHFYGNSLRQTWPWSSVVRGDARSGAQQLVRGCCSSSLQGMGRHKQTGFKGLQTFYQQEQGTRGLLSPYVQLSLVTVSSHTYLQMGSPPSKRTTQWNREWRNEWLPALWLGEKEESASFALSESGRVDSSNTRMVAY